MIPVSEREAWALEGYRHGRAAGYEAGRRAGYEIGRERGINRGIVIGGNCAGLALIAVFVGLRLAGLF